MKKTDPVQEAALRVLLCSERENKPVYDLLRAEQETLADARERAALEALVSAVVKHRITIDYVLDLYSATKTEKMKPVLRTILRMAAARLLFSDTEKDALTVDSAVRLARAHGLSGLCGFVNGVLRSVAREKDNIEYPNISTRYSVPEWIAERLAADYGSAKAGRILQAYTEPRRVTLRLDRRLAKTEEEIVNLFQPIIRKAVEKGACAEGHPLLPYAVSLQRAGDVRALPGFAEGHFMPQDVSSMLVTEVAGLKAGDTVIDVCAAPGGKSLHAAECLAAAGGTEGVVYAFDKTEDKCGRIRENARRMRLENVEVAVWDARTAREDLYGRADVVYCDLPCSGLGVLSHKADVKYRLKPEDIPALQALQREILCASVRYLKDGGVLVYSTCTLTREENEENAAYIRDILGLKPDSLVPYLPEVLRETPSAKDGYLTLFPGAYRTDGFFIARFVKGRTPHPSASSTLPPSPQGEGLDLKSMYVTELREFLERMGEPAFRAKQVFSWLHREQVRSFGEMTNLPKALRERLTAEEIRRTKALGTGTGKERQTGVQAEGPRTLAVRDTQTAKDGTKKYLLETADGHFIECVRMRYRFGNSVCVSSQAGCAMGCRFCASTADGLKRNLTATEMLEEVYTVVREEKAARVNADTGAGVTGSGTDKPPVSRVVIMGMGEPLQNTDRVIRFITLLTDPDGYGMSRRHVTVSTCGLPDGICRMAREMPRVNLAVSLHAAIQEKREEIMPIAKQVTLPALLDACRFHVRETGRQMTFEYALIRGFNDTNRDAEALRTLLSGMEAMVNLIPVNPVREAAFSEPDRTDVLKFKKNLEKKGIHVTIRRETGREIDGACGQLAGRYRGSNT